MNRAQALADAQRALKEAYPDRWLGILEALEQRLLPTLDAPVCPNKKCGAALGTPVAKADHGFRASGNLLCPGCGEIWTGTDAEVAQAIESWRAYQEQESGLTKARDEEAEQLVRMIVSFASARCQTCPNGATCIGTTEGTHLWLFQCDECCHHDVGEGVHCQRLRGVHPGQRSLFGDGTPGGRD